MLREIGKVVATARKRLNLSVETLAKHASVEVSMLAELEKGTPGITTTEIGRVAEQLELDPAALLLGRAAARPKSSVFLRHQGLQDFDFGSEVILDNALEGGRSLRFLNASLGTTPTPRLWSKANLLRVGKGPAVEGYRLANELRGRIKIPKDALPDLRELLEERFEIPVVVESLSAKMTAVSVRDPNGAAAVILNADDEQRRLNPHLDRVHLAHELAHIMCDPSDGGLHIVADIAEKEAETSVVSDVERAEQRAKAFAAELLMPLIGLLDLLGTPRCVESETKARECVSKARQKFSTPWEIAVNHLNHHGFVADGVRLALLHQGSRDALAGAVVTTLPARGASSIALAKRVTRAHGEGIITDGQARVALGLSADDPLPWV